uniref:tRNA-binding domain-containing protein n=1 Tax=Corethron hystrix TaxID=216773 RepID=A0A7S1C0F2_9STRA|mmetsp:Transcript_7509/g.16263  ORF Transcript_7509/g.16263 Transcript_7509/m.16263 type:complete len:358 (+) Transcript_7509:58-1131(+)
MSQSDPTSDACLGTLTLPPLGKNPTPHLKVLHLIVPILPPHQISIVRGKSLSLSLPTGASLSMPLAVVTELILRCKFADPSLSALIPNDSMGRAAIGSYFRLRSTDGLEGHFCSRSFAAGPRCTSPTLADLGLLFGHFGGENAASIASECGPNVERWFRTTAAFAAEMAERGGSVVTVPSVSIDRSVPVFCFPGVESNMPAKAVESIAGTKNTKEGDDKGSSKDADGKNTAVDAVKSGQLSEEQKAAVAAKRAAKKGKKKKEAAPGKNQQKKEDDFNISSLDIRVGLIKRAWEHETAEKLYCEEIDVGEEKPRTIASGLRAFYKLEDMQNRRVLVLCNLKSRNLVGFPSHGKYAIEP